MTNADWDETYVPSETEDYMNPKMLMFFRRKLLEWKDSILEESKATIEHLQEESSSHPDVADRASAESERALELRTRDRQRKLISKIDEAIKRIDDDEYGYCEDTGEPIGISRLIARPVATLSIDAQERHERNERIQRDEWE